MSPAKDIISIIDRFINAQVKRHASIIGSLRFKLVIRNSLLRSRFGVHHNFCTEGRNSGGIEDYKNKKRVH